MIVVCKVITVIINKGGNTYIRPFVRNDINRYHILQGDFCLIYIFLQYERYTDI